MIKKIRISDETIKTIRETIPNHDELEGDEGIYPTEDIAEYLDFGEDSKVGKCISLCKADKEYPIIVLHSIYFKDILIDIEDFHIIEDPDNIISDDDVINLKNHISEDKDAYERYYEHWEGFQLIRRQALGYKGD